MKTEKTKVRRTVKNTIFLDLFSIPRYMLEMLKTLHPEMTDLKEGDIVPVTLNPVILKSQYNDLALLVKDKLIIFVEAQSTWSINILVRILLYLAATYQEYILERKLNVYTSFKLTIPEPEFYVIYTGGRKIDKDIISLREDLWHNPDAKIDLLVKVIHLESNDDVIGQYIIFTHVLDEQIKIHGRKKLAAENAIRICQDRGVLKDYLEGRKKEVVDIMMMLFDQDYAVTAYGWEQERKGEKKGERKGAIENTVKMCQRFGRSVDEAVHMLAEDFNLTLEKASAYVNKFWKNS